RRLGELREALWESQDGPRLEEAKGLALCDGSPEASDLRRAEARLAAEFHRILNRLTRDRAPLPVRPAPVRDDRPAAVAPAPRPFVSPESASTSAAPVKMGGCAPGRDAGAPGRDAAAPPTSPARPEAPPQAPPTAPRPSSPGRPVVRQKPAGWE